MNPPSIVVQLIHIHGGLKGEIQEFEDAVISIGRLSTCMVRFPADEPGVSREHARIQREGNQFRLTDLSKYGTFVNGKEVKDALLRSGDVIEFGPGGPKVSITMEVGAQAQMQQPVAPSAPPFIPETRPCEAPAPRERVAEPTPQPPVAPPVAAAEPVPEPPAAPAAPPPVQVQKTMAPLVIQYGPSIRTYRELPVTVGAGGGADFQVRHPGIHDRHVQLFFHQDAYWVRDLTGQAMVRVNLETAGNGVRLHPSDEIVCGPQGPIFRFLGEGRLAEVEPVVDEPATPARVSNAETTENPNKREGGNLFSRFVKGFKE